MNKNVVSCILFGYVLKKVEEQSASERYCRYSNVGAQSGSTFQTWNKCLISVGFSNEWLFFVSPGRYDLHYRITDK